MAKLKKNFLRNFYLFILIIIFLIVILIPFLVKNFNFVHEDYVEFISLIFLLSLGFITNHLYKKEATGYENKIVGLKNESEIKDKMIEDNFRYIGSLNVRMQELESALNKIKKYPATKNEMKTILQYMANRILSMVNVEWTMIRIVNLEKMQTLLEVCVFRNNKQIKLKNIPNNNLVNNDMVDNIYVVLATEKTFTINTYCILPMKVNREQKIMIEAIVNQIDMLYIIFASEYYKEKDYTNNKPIQ
jgi:hypothetical protein